MNEEEKQKFFEVIAQKTGIAIEEIKSDFDHFKTEFKNLNTAGSDEDAIEYALGMVQNKYKSILLTPQDKFEGILIGMTRVRDANGFQRREALKLYETNPDDALAKGLIRVENNEPVVIDTRQFLDSKGTIPNPNYNKPLQERKFRTLIGFGSINGAETTKLTKIYLRGDKIDLNPPLFTSIEITGKNTSKDTDPFYTLNSNKGTHFKVLEQQDVDIEEIIKIFGKDLLVPLDLLRDKLNKEKAKGRNSVDVITTGIVDYIRLEPFSNGSRMLTIDKPGRFIDDKGNVKEPITVFLPPHISIDFGRGSKLYVFGRLSENRREFAGETFVTLQMNCYGLYAPPNRKVVPDTVPLSPQNSPTVSIDDAEGLDQQDWES